MDFKLPIDVLNQLPRIDGNTTDCMHEHNHIKYFFTLRAMKTYIVIGKQIIYWNLEGTYNTMGGVSVVSGTQDFLRGNKF